MVTEVGKENLQYAVSLRGRKRVQKSYKEEESDPNFELDPEAIHDDNMDGNDKDGVVGGDDEEEEEEEEDESVAVKRSSRLRSSGGGGRQRKDHQLNGFIVSDSDGEAGPHYKTRSKSAPVPNNVNAGPTRSQSHHPNTRSRDKVAGTATADSRTSTRRMTRQSARVRHEEAGYEDEAGEDDADADGSSYDEEVDLDASQTSPSPGLGPQPELQVDEEEQQPDIDGEGEDDDEHSGPDRKYKLRKRAPVNYAIPPPLEELILENNTNGRRKDDRGGKSNFGRNKPFKWGATGAELSRIMGIPDSDSDSDGPTKTPRKGFGATSNGATAAGLGGSMMANGSTGAIPEFGAGTPSNLGRVGENCMFVLNLLTAFCRLNILQKKKMKLWQMQIRWALTQLSLSIQSVVSTTVSNAVIVLNIPFIYIYIHIFSRYNGFERNDPSSTTISGTISAVQFNTPSRCVVPWPARNWQDTSCSGSRI